MPILYLDTETYSELNIRATGGHRYAEHCELMLLAYAVDDAPVAVWEGTVTPSMPTDLHDALTAVQREPDEWIVVAHNSAFDRHVLRYTTPFEIPIRSWRDTTVLALSLALPAALGQLGEALGFSEDQQKLETGKKLINLFCGPAPKNHKVRRYTSAEKPLEWAQFIQYAAQDVEAMRRVWKTLPKFNYRREELELWFLDQKINDRGVQTDLKFAQSVIDVLVGEKERLIGEMNRVTEGAVSSPTKVADLKTWVESFVGELPGLDKAIIADLLDNPDLPPVARKALRIRQAASKTSTAKYARIISATGAGGRIRGMYQFDGASRTKRWAGRLVQLQNLPSRTGLSETEIACAIDASINEYAPLLFDDIMTAASAAVRGAFVAPAGKKFVVSDLSNIEGRYLAFLAGEEWKLQAFRDYDAGIGPDIYKLAYSRSFGVPVEDVTDEQRSVGKVQELAFGFNGGVHATVTMAANYRIDLQEVVDAVIPIAPDWAITEATNWWGFSSKKGDIYGLPKDQFIACDVAKRLWRRQHPATESLWGDCHTAASNAINTPGQTFRANTMKFLLTVRNGIPFLLVRPPSQRYLVYPFPEVKTGSRGRTTLWYKGQKQEQGSPFGEFRLLPTYGGRIVQNATQHDCSRILGRAMLRAEDAGYPIVLHSHDEAGAEVDDTDEWTQEGLSAILAQSIEWAPGLPLAATGFEDYRYRKG